jgi:hypothetical protein
MSARNRSKSNDTPVGDCVRGRDVERDLSCISDCQIKKFLINIIIN